MVCNIKNNTVDVHQNWNEQVWGWDFCTYLDIDNKQHRERNDLLRLVRTWRFETSFRF